MLHLDHQEADLVQLGRELLGEREGPGGCHRFEAEAVHVAARGAHPHKVSDVVERLLHLFRFGRGARHGQRLARERGVHVHAWPGGEAQRRCVGLDRRRGRVVLPEDAQHLFVVVDRNPQGEVLLGAFGEPADPAAQVRDHGIRPARPRAPGNRAARAARAARAGLLTGGGAGQVLAFSM